MRTRIKRNKSIEERYPATHTHIDIINEGLLAERPSLPIKAPLFPLNDTPKSAEDDTFEELMDVLESPTQGDILTDVKIAWEATGTSKKKTVKKKTKKIQAFDWNTWNDWAEEDVLTADVEFPPTEKEEQPSQTADEEDAETQISAEEDTNVTENNYIIEPPNNWDGYDG